MDITRPPQIPQSSAVLKYLSQLLVFAVACLIFIGALVTSHQAGLAVPDWPTTYGENMFLYPISKWQGGILYEHGHRLFASIIGIITVLLFIFTLLKEKRTWIKVLTFAALIAVITQGVLGGLTVLYLLPTAISVSHAMLGQTFLVIVIAIAYLHANESLRNSSICIASQSTAFKLNLIALALLYVQLFLGALMRHTHSGLAIPDFPTMGGQWLPYFDLETIRYINDYLAEIRVAPVDLAQILIHLAHRVFAIVVTVYILWAAIKVYKIIDVRAIRKTSAILVLAVLTQFAMGITTVLSGKQPYLTSLHVVLGAILLGLVTLQCMRTYNWKSQ